MTKKFTVHQFVLPEFLPSEVIDLYYISMKGKVVPFSCYAKVAEIEADNLDQVFEYGNIGPEEYINRIGRMRSVSVGDLIEDEDGSFHIVASVGFRDVTHQIQR